MPTSVRVAVIVMGVLAALLLSNAALSWYSFEIIIDELIERNTTIDRDVAESTITQNIVLFAVLGALLAVSAWFFSRRRPWARWVGLAASAAMVLLSLFSTVVAGGVTIYGLLALVLSVAAVTSLLARTTVAWTSGSRAQA